MRAPDALLTRSGMSGAILWGMKYLVFGLTLTLLVPFTRSAAATNSVAAAGPAAAQEGLSLERPGDGRLVCGLGKEFHAGRRALLMERVGEELMVFRGMREVRENFAFRQDKTFWYLTGVESPKASLVLDGKTKRAILFLPERSRYLEMM